MRSKIVFLSCYTQCSTAHFFPDKQWHLSIPMHMALTPAWQILCASFQTLVLRLIYLLPAVGSPITSSSLRPSMSAWQSLEDWLG